MNNSIDLTTVQADALFEQGENLFQKDSSSDYYVFFEKASEIYWKVENWEKYLWCQCKMTDWLNVKNHVQKAKKITEEGLELCNQKITVPHELKAEFHYRLFKCNFLQRHYEQAHLHAAQMLEIAQALNHNRLTAKAYLSMANVNMHTEKYAHSLSLLFKALPYTKESADKSEKIDLWKSIGHAYFHLKQYQLSKIYFLRTVYLFKQHFGSDSLFLANPMIMLGKIDMRVGDYTEALKHYEKALKIKEKHAIEDVELSYLFSLLGEIYFLLEKWENADNYFEKAIRTQKNINEKDFRWFAAAYYQWANLHLQQNRLKQGRQFLEKAKAVLLPTNAAFLMAHTYLLEVDFACAAHEFNYALKVVTQANKYVEDVGVNKKADSHLLKFSLYEKQLNVYWNLYQNSSSKTFLEKGHQLLPKIQQHIESVRLSFFNEADKLTFNQAATNIYHLSINLLYVLYSLQPSKKLLEEIFSVSEKNKVHSLLASIQSFEALQLSKIPKQHIEKLQMLPSQINNCQVFLTQQGKRLLPEEKFDEKSKELARLQIQYHQLILQIEQENPAYFALKHQMPSIHLSDFQVQLAHHQIAISYVLEAEFLYLLYIDNQNIHLKRISLPPHFPQLLDTFIDEAILGMNRKAYVKQAHQLYQLLIAPIEGKLNQNKIQSLLILPDSHLLELPFGLLLTEASSFKTAYSSLPYLLKKYNITYHYSATLRQYQQQRNQGSKNLTPQFLGFAPVYDNQHFPSEVSEALPALATRDISIRGSHYKALLYSEKEVKDIEDTFREKGYNSQVFLRSKANLTRFKEKAQRFTPKYLHIAAHGVSNRRKNVLGILFSPEKEALSASTFNVIPSKKTPLQARQQTASSSQSAILYAHELYQLKLKSDLVFLSCCESGVGRIAEGEGILSLNRGLLYAGVPNIVFTLFKIYDQTTAILAHHFYDYLLNQEDNYAQALRYAKLQLLKEDLPPRYWGGFLLLGD